jgi:hypothetical protein
MIGTAETGLINVPELTVKMPQGLLDPLGNFGRASSGSCINRRRRTWVLSRV